VFVLLQSIAQVVALTVLRRRQPGLKRPYRMALYPWPSVVALIGWAYVYVSSGKMPIVFSLVWIGLGVVAFLGWAKVERTWPFGPREIREEFLERAAREPQSDTAAPSEAAIEPS